MITNQLVKIEGGKTVYPVRLTEAFPNALLPAVVTEESVGPLPDGYFFVHRTDPPVGKFGVIEEGVPELVDGRFVQKWVFTPYDLNTVKSDLIRQIELKAKQLRDSVVVLFSPAEMASWSIKRDEAIRFSASGAESDAPNLSQEAYVRGITLATLAEKVLAKSAQLAGMEARIAGRCGALQDAAAVATTDAELLAIDLEAGWPV